MAKAKSKVIYGRNMKKHKRVAYDFDKLRKPDDCFMVRGRANYGSIRSQASKQGKRRGIKYSVNKTPEGIIVTLEHYLPEIIAA